MCFVLTDCGSLCVNVVRNTSVWTMTPLSLIRYITAAEIKEAIRQPFPEGWGIKLPIGGIKKLLIILEDETGRIAYREHVRSSMPVFSSGGIDTTTNEWLGVEVPHAPAGAFVTLMVIPFVAFEAPSCPAINADRLFFSLFGSNFWGFIVPNDFGA